MNKKTTKEYFEKYNNLALKLNVNLSNANLVLGKTREQLLGTYQRNQYLTNLPIYLFEERAKLIIAFNPKENLSLVDAIEVYKHSIYYHFLKLNPEFIEE